MARANFRVDQGIEIRESNGTSAVWLLQGSGAPTGTSGPTDDAPIGSMWHRNDGAGETYHKKSSTSSASDWERMADESVYTALGIAFDDEDMGTFTGDIITDNTDAKTALQELETELVDTRGNVDDLITLSGVAENASDLGTFTGDIITDNSDIKDAMQELETELVDTRDNTDDLITLSGVAENATDLGTFTGTTIADARKTKEALQDLETALELISGGATSDDDVAAATPTTVATCLVDDCNDIEWEVQVWEQGDKTKREAFKLSALHDGTPTTDAAAVDSTAYAKRKVPGGGIAGLTYDVVLSGAAGSQTIGVQISATAAVTVTTRRTNGPAD